MPTPTWARAAAIRKPTRWTCNVIPMNNRTAHEIIGPHCGPFFLEYDHGRNHRRTPGPHGGEIRPAFRAPAATTRAATACAATPTREARPHRHLAQPRAGHRQGREWLCQWRTDYSG